MCQCPFDGACRLPRRGFLRAAGVAAAGLAMGRCPVLGADAPAGGSAKQEGGQDARSPRAEKGVARIRAAFLYPPTEELKKQGYYSWPGSSFDAEGHHRKYSAELSRMAGELGVNLQIDGRALANAADADRFIAEVKQHRPDGLVLVAFKKSEWEQVKRISDATQIPTIAMATIGVLLMPHIQEMRDKPGVFTISSLDNFEAIRKGLTMIRTIRWMKDAVLLSISGSQRGERVVPVLGTKIASVPMQDFIDQYKGVSEDAEVGKLAREYLGTARERREPSEQDVTDAARATIACRRLLAKEKGDAFMMTCLEGIAKRQIPPPCMGFMDLRDEGIVAGCQNDIDATLTMMIGQQLLGKPGFQHNPACDTEKNLYYASHCTSPRRLNGKDSTAEKYILRSHAEAGIGAVPQVLWPVDQPITVAQYVAGDNPHMWMCTGRVTELYDMPPAGGCRTNMMAQLNELPACAVKPENMLHPTMFAGHHADHLRAFCQLAGITIRA